MLTWRARWSFIFLVLFLPFGGQPAASALDAAASPVAEQQVSLDYVDTSLTTVLKAIAYSYDLNLVITKDLTGQVSAQLKNVPLNDALNAILNVNGYVYTRKDNIIYVMPKGEEEQKTESVQLSYLAAKDAKQLLSKVISERGDIQVNTATNSLVIADNAESIAKVKVLVREIDVAPTQVLIEARVVDIKSSEFENLGVALNATYAPGGGLFSRSTLSPESMSMSSNMAVPQGGQQFKLLTTLKSFSPDMTIDALVQKNKARILASPSIATLSGQEARIIIGERYPYTQVTNSPTGNTQSTVFIDVGTTLRVTPMVSPDGWITMKVHPEVSSVTAELAAGPRITTREADATIRVKDNTTIIIGGLINRKDDRTKAGIPVLRSIPVLGWFFKRHNIDLEDAELTVFITPHILRTPQERMEAAENKSAEVFIDLPSRGQDMDILSGLLSYADRIERDANRNTSNDLYLNLELIEVYKGIFKQFPHSGKSDYFLYKIVEIYAAKFGKCLAAAEALEKLKESFPGSFYVADGNARVRACQDEHSSKF